MRAVRFFSLIDVTSMATGKDHDYAGQQIRILQEKYPEFREITNWHFYGQGQRSTPACDLLTLASFIMKLPNVDYSKCFKLLTTLGVSVGVSEKAILIALQKTVAKRLVEPPEARVVRNKSKERLQCGAESPRRNNKNRRKRAARRRSESPDRDRREATSRLDEANASHR